MGEITQLLVRARDGDPGQLTAVFEALYPELKRLAASRVRRSETTMTPTVLVHEFYLRLAGESLSLVDRRHFFAAAAQSMRWILVDHARRKHADKRGGGMIPVTLEENLAQADAPGIDVLALHEGLDALELINTQQRQVVELHYFAGLGFAEIAELLECSERTTHRHWDRARAFLHVHLGDR
jgi:RNA polymerase sigma factor (TIGR02999 family)